MSNSRGLTAKDERYLQQLGLSNHAMALYSLLLKHDSLTARQAGDLSGEFPAAEYRLFQQLERLGLVRRERRRPVQFTAVAKDVGLRAAYVQSRHQLDNLLAGLELAEGNAEQRLELIIGRQALYERYAELAETAQQTIGIYAIGIAYSADLLQAQQAALKRGVQIRHVLQQIKPSNFHVAHKWQRLGVQLRYAPSARGFHLMLFDKQSVLVTFSDPQNTDDRLSILTTNPSAVRLFSTHFEDIWQQAKQVEL
jgi:sugar-specific transcriptional regulator TrmB